MIKVRKAAERGHFDHGWLDTSHTFSFAGYQDPAHMGFRSLRVMNEDFVREGEGFGEHGHRDMEILTYVLEGKLRHGDSLGNGDILERDRVQHMRAGTGIRHSEENGGKGTVHFYQIWLLPDRAGLAPAYADKTFDPAGARGRFQLLASPGGEGGSHDIAQDAKWYRIFLKAGEEAAMPIAAGRHAWAQVVSGSLTLNQGTALATSDGAALSEEAEVRLKASEDSEVLVFDLA